MGSCANLHPYRTEPVQPGLESKANESLEKLPRPENKIVAAVYRFRDQTGQYKPSQQSISYSTAVTQGATSILIKAMEESGWFTTIEREGISNLLNERRIIQSTRQKNNDKTQLRPLLFAGILLEGGIIGYDSNILTGGAGIRYLGMDLSGKFRKDQVTIYLRAVATSTGRVLKTVHTTKSILSQELSGGVFRYIDSNELLESEAGLTFNEPPVMAVTEAIDEAVKQLIVAGVEEGLWKAENPQAFNAYKAKFVQEKDNEAEQQHRDYYGLIHNRSLRSGFSLATTYSYGSYIGSYGNETLNSGFMLQLEQSIAPALSLRMNIQRSVIGSRQVFSKPVTNAELLLTGYMTPDFKLSPYAGIGGGLMAYDEIPEFTDQQTFPTLSAEAGVDYRFSDTFGLKVGFNYRYMIQDGVDGVKVGTIHDQQWNIITGITIHP